MNNKHADYTTDRLHHLRRAKDRTRRFCCLLSVLTLALATMFALALLDYWLLLPFGARAAGMALLAALLAGGGVRLIRLFRKPSTTKDIALELESRRPDLGCVVSTAAEYLPGGREAAQAYEPELVAALHQQAARNLLLIEALWWRKQLLSGFYIAFGTLVFLALLATLLPEGGTAFSRVLWPWNQAAYTRIEVRPGDLELPEGTDQEVEATFSGRLPREARLEWRKTGDADWQSGAMRPLEARKFIAPLFAIRGDLRYRVSSRGVRSREFSLASFVPPEWKQVRVRVETPAYTKEPLREEDSPNLSVLRGSRLDFRFTTSGSLTNASLRFANQSSVQLNPVETNIWTASMTATRETYYWLDLADAKGRKGGNLKPFKLTVLPDEKPIVDIVEPGLDIRAEPTTKVRLAVSASDDYRVRDVRLIFRKMAGEWRTNSVALPENGGKEVTPVAELDLSALHLKEYEVAAYYAEARDNNTLDGPGVGRSPVYFVEYTTKEQALSQCRGNGTKVNLLEMQKQIIAATTALSDPGEESKLRDLARIQRETKTFALIYKDGFHLAIAPPQARDEFAAALEAMDHASAKLDGLSRGPGLKHEESALQHLYEACRLLPELEAGMCKGEGNCMKIVLEAIEKIREQQKQERRAGLPQAITQARRLSELQQRLIGFYRQQQGQTNAPSNALIEGGAANSGQSRHQRTDSLTRPGATNDSDDVGELEPKRANRVARAGGGKQSAEPVDPEGNAGRDKTPNPDRQGSGQKELELTGPTLSQEQQKLAEAAVALAQELATLAGKDARVSFRYSEMVSQTSDLWSQASHAVANNQTRAAGDFGALGISLMRKVLTALEVIYGEDSPVGDFAAEEYPREFEAQISDYLKRLSYAQ